MRGWTVRIHTVPTDVPIPQTVLDCCTSTTFSKADSMAGLWRLIGFLTKRGARAWANLVRAVVFALQSLRASAKSGDQRSMANLTIGVDQVSGLAGWLRSLIRGERFVYLSLELPVNEPRGLPRGLHHRALASATALIIQDEDRLAALTRDYPCRTRQVFFIPNSTMSDIAPDETTGGNYFRDKFALDPVRFPNIVLQAGTVEDGTYPRELAAAFREIEGFALVLHERRKRSPDDPFMAGLRDINSTTLFLSLDPVPFEEIDRVFRSATIGCALYKDFDSNWGEIAMASGKLSFYLKHGIPVLMSNLNSLVKLNERYVIGRVILDPGNAVEVRQELTEIMGRYEELSANCKRCFKELFDFETRADPFFKFIASERQ